MEKRKLTVLYGSQTGTAQEVAERIWRDSKRYHFHGSILAMDDYPVSQLIYETCIIFVCSTTGQGEEPDNMKQFWKFLLRKNLPTDSLKSTRFCVLGLGDSSYSKFNYAAKKLDKRLLQLGGIQLYVVGLADDQHDLGYSAVVDFWVPHVFSKLMELYPLPAGVKVLDQDFLNPPRWHVSIVPCNKPKDHCSKVTPSEQVVDVNCSKVCMERENKTGDEPMVSVTKSERMDKESEESKPVEMGHSQSNPYIVTVLKNSRTTTQSHFQDVRLIEFSAPELKYLPGDVLSVVPHNAHCSVDKLFMILYKNKLTKLSPSTVLHITEREVDMPVPKLLQEPVTLQECADKYWDLNAIPKRYFFQLLSHFTPSKLEREKLFEFTTSEGHEELYNYAYRPRRTCLEALDDFPHASANIPVDYLFELFQPIRPRAFSIASSPTAHRKQVHILVAVVKYQTKIVKPRFGLCSTWLAGLNVGDQVPVWVRSGSFKFPTAKDEHVIMIGPGTGVAPFRSYIHERVATGSASKDLLILFFGCRNKCGDYHCQDEWNQMHAKKQLLMMCAFSRDQEDKVYVQHRIRDTSTYLWELISLREAYIFLAGNSKNMPAAVKDALIFDVFVEEGKMKVPDAKMMLCKLEQQGRFQCETWS